MPELNLTPSPMPPSGSAVLPGTGPAESAARATDGTAPGDGSASASSFSSVLDSHITQADAASAVAARMSAPDIAATPDADSVPVDLSALFSLLGIDPAAFGMQSAATSKGIEAAAANEAPGATEMLAASATIADAGTVPLVVAINGEPASAVRPAPTIAMSPSGTHAATRLSADRSDSPGMAPAGANGIAGGKLDAEPAISADADTAARDPLPAAAPAEDFRALLDRVTGNGAMTPASAVVTARPAGTPLRVDAPLGAAGWQDEVGQKLTWMVNSATQHADLVLSPPNLGRLEVSLTLAGDQATAIFTSPNPAVRDAIESSVERLRVVLAEAGVTLGQTQVGSESPSQSPASQPSRREAGDAPRASGIAALPASISGAVSGTGRGMIDVFA